MTHGPARPRLFRIACIHQRLREGVRVSAARLARELEVSGRTAARDLACLRDTMGAPVAFDRARRRFYYTEPGFELPALRLREGELVSLMIAVCALRQYEGTRFEADLRRAFHKLQLLLPNRVSLHVGELAGALSFVQSAPRPLRRARYEQLVRAVRERRRLRIAYRRLGSRAPVTRDIDPYHLACVDGAWYLAAYCHRRGEVRLFVPERMAAVRETGVRFEPPRRFVFSDFIGDAFRLMLGRERHLVRLRFTGPWATFVSERRWHASQRVSLAPDHAACDLEMTVSHLPAVAAWVQSFGGACRVLAPAALRVLVRRGHEAGRRANGARCRARQPVRG